MSALFWFFFFLSYPVNLMFIAWTIQEDLQYTSKDFKDLFNNAIPIATFWFIFSPLFVVIFIGAISLILAWDISRILLEKARVKS